MLKVKANEQKIKIGKYADTYRYVMAPELYATLNQNKVIKEAALRSGISKGVMQAAWDAAGEVIKAWATEGHSVAIPGLGSSSRQECCNRERGEGWSYPQPPHHLHSHYGPEGGAG